MLTGQPQSTANASRKPPEIFREPRRRSGSETRGSSREENRRTCKKSANSATTRIDSIRRAGRQLGFPCPRNGWLLVLGPANLGRRVTCFAMHIEGVETIEQLALFRRANVRVEFNNRCP